jgi:hypothetical protein
VQAGCVDVDLGPLGHLEPGLLPLARRPADRVRQRRRPGRPLGDDDDRGEQSDRLVQDGERVRELAKVCVGLLEAGEPGARARDGQSAKGGQKEAPT